MTTSTTERSVVDVLRAARERISDPERWTQGVYARDRFGDAVPPRMETAVCWCARGAVRQETVPNREGREARRMAERHLRAAAAPFAPGVDEPIANVNDSFAHDTVLDVFDAAIELAEAEA